MKIGFLSHGRRESQILTLTMIPADAKEVCLPDLAGLRSKTKGIEWDGHDGTPDLLRSIYLGRRAHSALPLPVLEQQLAIDLQITPLAGRSDFELFIYLVVRLKWRADEGLTNIPLPE